MKSESGGTGARLGPEGGGGSEGATHLDYLLTASDADIGYPADDNRLVQRLTWYSLSDTVYPTSNLVDPTTGEFTLLGQTFANYAAGLIESP